MKKTLLLSGFLMASFFTVNAQTLVTENFNSLVIGNVTTETTGATAGQGSYYLFSNNGAAPTTSTNAGVTNTQIVAGGNASQGLQLTGPDGDKGGRFLWKDGLPTIWAARTSGNNIVELEIDINPGAGTTASRNTIGAYIYNADGSKVLAGFVVRAATRELFLVAYSTPTGAPAAANYNYSLAAAPGIQLPANVFSRVGISFNKTTGAVVIKAPGLTAGAGTTGSAVGLDPAEIDFVGNSGTGGTPLVTNTVAASMIMDNLTVKASSTDTLLGVEQVGTVSQFSVYPNPTTGIVNISNDSNVILQSVNVTDLNGRTVKSLKLDGSSEAQINISDLSAGVYMMNITSEQGSVIKKIIKN